MPYRMWGYKLSCTACSHRLSGAILCRTVQRVLDTDGWYFIATEYLECRCCRKKVVGWSQDVLDQLHHIHQDEFPAILTYRLPCDKKLIGQMRERTLGNRANRLRRYLLEEHTRSWMLRSKKFLFAFAKFIKSGAEPSATPPLPPRVTPVPGAKWLLSVYAREVASRLEETKARITSIFGSILKMDSTKKWDLGDVARLQQAKAGEAGKGTQGSGYRSIPLKELACHCRRRRRPAGSLTRCWRPSGIPLKPWVSRFWTATRSGIFGRLRGAASTASRTHPACTCKCRPGGWSKGGSRCRCSGVREVQLCWSRSICIWTDSYLALQPAQPIFRPISWKAWRDGTRTVRQNQWRQQTMILSATVANSSTPSMS
ncbi:uncharacterized protein LOC120538738 [Polypterus senegalus]|uniref:uncharacterized protein LOC120538738 n=1 Tax=Polypterus senegalus TaxID=55291 RepID=UPI0019642C0D|nr:uncharacterized protein LOC120538738 [Polypterus senegalus]XP_039624100.1 uncharacterized protein LOC120538738 [Polypterus senegalus]XP_039624101.1 uncharacterized protein LOC120538738 [Polypterus senegalus]XP_039624102.1 uncharacterized protein LOC120538738 [Polypterus senegalus]